MSLEPVAGWTTKAKKAVDAHWVPCCTGQNGEPAEGELSLVEAPEVFEGARSETDRHDPSVSFLAVTCSECSRVSWFNASRLGSCGGSACSDPTARARGRDRTRAHEEAATDQAVSG